MYIHIGNDVTEIRFILILAVLQKTTSNQMTPYTRNQQNIEHHYNISHQYSHSVLLSNFALGNSIGLHEPI